MINLGPQIVYIEKDKSKAVKSSIIQVFSLTYLIETLAKRAYFHFKIQLVP